MTEQRLDEETERDIAVLAGSYSAIGLANAADALRNRIRSLIEEARKEGEQEFAKFLFRTNAHD